MNMTFVIFKESGTRYYEVDQGVMYVPRVGDTVSVPGSVLAEVTSVIWYYNEVGGLKEVEVFVR